PYRTSRSAGMSGRNADTSPSPCNASDWVDAVVHERPHPTPLRGARWTSLLCHESHVTLRDSAPVDHRSKLLDMQVILVHLQRVDAGRSGREVPVCPGATCAAIDEVDKCVASVSAVSNVTVITPLDIAVTDRAGTGPATARPAARRAGPPQPRGP